MGQWYANVAAGNRALQELKKISIVEAKGYCYGWHFYQCADADLVISSRRRAVRPSVVPLLRLGSADVDLGADDGAAAVPGDGLHRAAVHGRGDVDCNFLNKVVPRDELEAEVEKYALACARNRPVDSVFQQKVFFEVVKQFQGEYMGSLLSAVFESMGRS